MGPEGKKGLRNIALAGVLLLAACKPATSVATQSERTPESQPANPEDLNYAQQVENYMMRLERALILNQLVSININPNDLLGSHPDHPDHNKHPFAVIEGATLTTIERQGQPNLNIRLTYENGYWGDQDVTYLHQYNAEPGIIGQHLGRMYPVVLEEDMNVQLQPTLFSGGGQVKDFTLQAGTQYAFIPALSGMPGQSTSLNFWQTEDGDLVLGENGQAVGGAPPPEIPIQESSVTQSTRGGLAFIVAEVGAINEEANEQWVQVMGVMSSGDVYELPIFDQFEVAVIPTPMSPDDLEANSPNQ